MKAHENHTTFAQFFRFSYALTCSPKDTREICYNFIIICSLKARAPWSQKVTCLEADPLTLHHLPKNDSLAMPPSILSPP